MNYKTLITIGVIAIGALLAILFFAGCATNGQQVPAGTPVQGVALAGYRTDNPAMPGGTIFTGSIAEAHHATPSGKEVVE